MSDVKFCDSCGTSLSAGTLFCHNCGQKQVVIEEKEISATDENYSNEPIITTPINVEPDYEKIEDNANSEPQSVSKDKEDSGVDSTDLVNESEENVEFNKAEDISMVEEPEKITSTEPELEPEPEPEPVNAITDNQQQEQKPDDSKSQVTYQPQPQLQPQPIYQQAPVPQQTPYVQQAPVTQQAPYVQQAPVAQQAPVPAPKKKKFPWFFTVLWLIMLVAVAVWAYLFFVHPTYDYPRFTEDAQRLVLFTVAIAILIYTLSLKLSMKKLKAIPAILMVIFGFIIFILFSMIELQDGDFLHDMVSNLVESVLPAFGE